MSQTKLLFVGVAWEGLWIVNSSHKYRNC